MADETVHPHRYVRRRDPVLGEWCVMCGRNDWDALHAEPTLQRRQHDPGALIEEPDLHEQGEGDR